MAAPPQCDWQTARRKIHERGEYLLETGMWSDCRFIVGTEPNQVAIEAHKLFLAMASPVFEAMFFGGMAEKDPIAILDVQPEAFKALLKYIYTDEINLSSFDQTCELCYGAKKYMLPHLVEVCTTHLWSDLHPKNACRAYEFAKLFEEPVLMEKCFHIICNETHEVLTESSFDDVELSTIMTIFDQDYLDISSELELFNALTRYASRHSSGAKVPRLEGTANASGEGSSRNRNIRDALVKIRFLTLSPQQFAEGPASSNLLTQEEKFAILMNISSPSTDVKMPEAFSPSTIHRQKKNCCEHDNIRALQMGFYGAPPTSTNGEENESSKKVYCTRQLLRVTECMNTSVLDCAVTFSCDKNIWVSGIQIPTQILMDVNDRQQQSFSNSTYSELLYAHLLDPDGSRMTYTHFTSRVSFRSLIDISFNRPVYIQKHKLYKVCVVLNKMGWYPIGTYPLCASVNGVVFSFVHGMCIDPTREGLIRSIIFTIPPEEGSSVPSIGPNDRDANWSVSN